MKKRREVLVKYKDQEQIFSIENDISCINLTEHEFGLGEEPKVTRTDVAQKPKRFLSFRHNGDFDSENREIFTLT